MRTFLLIVLSFILSIGQFYVTGIPGITLFIPIVAVLYIVSEIVRIKRSKQ